MNQLARISTSVALAVRHADPPTLSSVASESDRADGRAEAGRAENEEVRQQQHDQDRVREVRHGHFRTRTTANAAMSVAVTSS